MNFVSFCLQFITKNCIKKGRTTFKRFSRDILGVHPSVHEYIINRTMMEKSDFISYLQKNYKWWFENHYRYEDKTFFNCFTKDIIQELIQLREEFTNPEIKIEITLEKILSFFMSNVDCNTPKQIFILFLYCLSSKCFYFDRKGFGKKWKSKKETFLLYYLKDNVKYIGIQSFFFTKMVKLITFYPSLLQEIVNLRENDARMYNAMEIGFKLLTTLFVNKNIPSNSISLPIQKEICESTSCLLYSFHKDFLFGYKVLQKFYPVEIMHPKFRSFLIRTSYFRYILIWRLFHRDGLNKIDRVPNLLVSKIMMTNFFLPSIFCPTRNMKHFLSIY
jgi:hypothetical protein